MTVSPENAEIANEIFASRLLEIAQEYKRYERVDQTMHWSPISCIVPVGPPEEEAAFSASRSSSTHGRKLYFLYARKPWEYQSNVWGYKRAKEAIRAPWGQTLVKEAWEPVKLDPAELVVFQDRARSTNEEDPYERYEPLDPAHAYAIDGKDAYRAGEKNGLYIMFKTREGTPGTDHGWVYGTVSADGSKVTSVGLVENCMSCHVDAKSDRQLGLPKK